MLAAMATKGDITIKNCISKHLESISAKIIEMGGVIEDNEDSIRVVCNDRPKKVTIKTLPYPGFPTDLQPQVGVVLSLANGTSIINESIWESRFQYTAELNKMGANITTSGKEATIVGKTLLKGTSVVATDLRAGASLVIAGLVAEGTTIITEVEHILRGYEGIVDKLTQVGASIKLVDE